MTTLLFLSLIAALPTQPPGKCVLDEAHALAPAEFAQLEASCEAIDKSGDGQIEIVLTNDFRGEEKEEFANSLFHTWQIGYKDKNDGVLVVLSPSMKKWRIEIGYGLEGRLTDADTLRIGNDLGVPVWKDGRWGAGLIPVVSAIGIRMHKEAAVAPPSMSTADSGSGVWAVFFTIFFLIALAGLYFYLRRLQRREEEEVERQAYLARQAMADYRNDPIPYSQRVQSRPRRSTPTPPAHAAPLSPSVAAVAVVTEEPRRHSDDSSSSSYDSGSSSFDTGGFSGGGGGDSGGGGAGGDF